MDVERNVTQVKKLSDQCRQVDGFAKRLEIAEQKAEVFRENSERVHQNLSDTFQKTKDYMFDRMNQVTQFNDRINTLNEKTQNQNRTNFDFQEKMSERFVIIQQQVGQQQSELTETVITHKDDTTSMYKRIEEMKLELIDFNTKA